MCLKWKSLSILAISPVSQYNGFNTSIHRINALKSLGCYVEVIDSSLREISRQKKIRRRISNKIFNYGLPIQLSDGDETRKALLQKSSEHSWDILWLEKALDIDLETILVFKKACPNCLVIGFSPDDMNGRHNQSQQFLDSISLYDGFITTKSFNVKELRSLGCANPLFMPNGFDPNSFRPIRPTPSEYQALGGDIGFIGSYERERAQVIEYLAEDGFSVRVWGGGWNKIHTRLSSLRLEKKHLRGNSFCKACSAFKINLNFLRKKNRDLQTTRSVEIPACRGFMLAERTSEHQELFKEGFEAEFFSSKEELRDKCRYYLENDAARDRIAQAGFERCLKGGYSNLERIAVALSSYLEAKTQ